MLKREINIADKLKKGKTLLLFGPRRAGKTTLLKEFARTAKLKTVFYNGDNYRIQNKFSQTDIAELAKMVDGFEVLIIDEAQNIANIGRSLKILNDERPKLTVIATGSASFELRGQVGEPLLGRKTTQLLYPFSLAEILNGRQDLPPAVVWQEMRAQLLIYGMYPDSVLAKNDQERQDFLNELVDSLLLKDIFAYQEVKGSDLLFKLLALLAFQIGNEVSYSELAAKLGVNKITVQRYLDLLEKAFVVFRLGAFSRNLRNELTKTQKYFFYDNGVRNALIANFNPLDLRNDLGALWENFVINERLKRRACSGARANQYFWRTYAQKEIDLIEERDGKLFAYEIKYNPRAKAAAPKDWQAAYSKVSEFKIITPDNFLEWK
ncbi:putative AAA family ATPase [Candidatus Termititenax aidoneus]|uniref:AAA family ATPase n=1 Tax=Termititenax aidoneus TaxID=2218524 RepID=A0A388TBU8_TERA1|nr:putative AAA family ATPase [Candidatus Termititenax aidoneus]